MTNATISNEGSDTRNWGSLYLIGHSLGAHICGMAAKELKQRQNRWTVHRITGLDPAQPCFRNADPSVYLHKNDAPLVDVIHTNGKLLLKLGLGLPEAIGIYNTLYKTRNMLLSRVVSFFNAFFDQFFFITIVLLKIHSHGSFFNRYLRT